MNRLLPYLGLPSLSFLWVYLAIGAALFGTGFVSSWHIRTVMARADLVEQATATIAQDNKASTITEQVGEAAAKKEIEIRTITKTIVQKVPIYVTKKSDAQCVVPRGFVWLHDAAAANLPRLPGAPGKPYGAAAGVDDPTAVALSDIAATVAGNYGTYAEVVTRYVALQDWVRQQRTLSRK